MPTPPTLNPRSPRSSTLKTTTVPPVKSAAKIAAKSTRTPRSRAAEAITPAAVIDLEQRRALIAQAAYFRAEKRNFAPGFEVEDWISAETEVDTLLTLGVPKTGN